MKHVPTKRCDRLDRHEEHDWKQGAFARHCPGRTSNKLPARSRRAGHPRAEGK